MKEDRENYRCVSFGLSLKFICSVYLQIIRANKEVRYYSLLRLKRRFLSPDTLWQYPKRISGIKGLYITKRLTRDHFYCDIGLYYFQKFCIHNIALILYENIFIDFQIPIRPRFALSNQLLNACVVV